MRVCRWISIPKSSHAIAWWAFENRDIADQDFRNEHVKAGQVGAGHSVTALYEIKLNPEAQGNIATVHLRWKDPDSLKSIETSAEFFHQPACLQFQPDEPAFPMVGAGGRIC